MFYQAKDSRVLDGDEWLSVDVGLLSPKVSYNNTFKLI